MATATKRKAAAPTPVPVRFREDEERFLRMVTAHAKAESRSVSGQLKHYARIGLIAKDNPDIPLGMIEDILVAQEESKAGLGEPYKFGVVED